MGEGRSRFVWERAIYFWGGAIAFLGRGDVKGRGDRCFHPMSSAIVPLTPLYLCHN
ncbi:hypothetical protein [Sivoneniella epilithica]